MSNTQYAFLMKGKVPNRDALQASIDSLRFDLKLDPSFTPFTDSGFSPCVLNGIGDVGFEVAYQEARELDDLGQIAGNNDFCISMTWHGSMKDCATAMIVSCALAKDFGAVITYEGEPSTPLERLLGDTKGIIKDAMNGPVRHSDPPKPVAKKPWWKLW